jgi:hypothetical protein
MAAPTPELFEPAIDVHHRPYLSIMLGMLLETLRPHSTGELLCIDV